MKVFAGEWVKEVLQRLGMDESAPVESGMVARRVRGAQGKFAVRAGTKGHTGPIHLATFAPARS
jgi:preprotein translocase subunit SecA